MTEAFKTEQKLEKKEAPKKKFLYLLDEDQTEIKKLTQDDIEEVVKVMRKCAFDVTDREVINIIQYGMSYGCYVNRMLIGVGLSWPAYYDANEKKILNGPANAIYLEDPAVLLAYEGRGIRRILLKTREEEGRRNNFQYAISYLSEDMPKGGIEEHIKEAGSQLEKVFLSEAYEFYKTDRGIIALKRL